MFQSSLFYTFKENRRKRCPAKFQHDRLHKGYLDYLLANQKLQPEDSNTDDGCCQAIKIHYFWYLCPLFLVMLRC